MSIQKTGNVFFKPWAKRRAPRKILAMRFQAMGDLVITLPYLQGLKNSLPDTKLHLLTRREVSSIPKNLFLFDRVIEIGGGRNAKLQFVLCLLLIPYLWWQRYDVVLDLQNHKISRVVRFLLFPVCWSQFDRSSANAAGYRTKKTIEAAHICKSEISTAYGVRKKFDVNSILRKGGWDDKGDLVILNPAGAFVTRNWPLENYLIFANAWIEKVNANTFFIMLGLDSMKEKSAFLKKHLGEKLIDLVMKTTSIEAFLIAQKAKFVLSEDSGLMHMAWVQGVPTLALFGSSRGDWSAPLGTWSKCLNSADLSCRYCLKEICQYGDVRCLHRYTPEFVLSEALELISRN